MQREIAVSVHAIDMYLERVASPFQIPRRVIVRELRLAFLHSTSLTPLELHDLRIACEDGCDYRRVRYLMPKGSKARQQFGKYAMLIIVVGLRDYILKTCWIGEGVGDTWRQKQSKPEHLRREWRKINNRKVDNNE